MAHQNYHLVCFLIVLFLSACTKDDNEPMPQSSVSRLYVSNADTDASVMNTMIFDPADGITLGTPYSFDSKLPDGNGILFNPYSGTVFQVSRQNENVKTFTVLTDGSLKAGNSFIDESLKSAREMAFDRTRNLLYIASNIDSAIYVYSSANTLSGNVLANKKIKLNGQPWGIHLEGNNLYVVIDQDRAEVQLFENASELVVGTPDPSKKLIVTGAKRLHGITYSSARDVMILTDIGEASDGSDGAIHILTEVDTSFKKDGGTVSPARTIRGIKTLLGNPVDISWDSRADKDLIYIAEKANKRILVFNFGDANDVAPKVNKELSTFPEAIYLDAR